MNYTNQLIRKAFKNVLKGEEPIEKKKEISFTAKQIEDLREKAKAKSRNIINEKEVILYLSMKDLSWIDFAKSVLICIDFLKSLSFYLQKDTKDRISNYLTTFYCKTNLRIIVKDYEQDKLDRPHTEAELRKIIKPEHKELNELILLVMGIKDFKTNIQEHGSIKDEFQFDKIIRQPKKKHKGK